MEFFSRLPDPRRENHNTKLHELLDIVVIAVLAVIAGADDWEEIAEFGESRKRWLKTFCALPNGIPSHDTFARVFSILDHVAFEKCFVNWTKTLVVLKNGDVVALDGKSSCASHGTDARPLHIVNAFSTRHGLALGQKIVDQKSNEITAIPELLNALVLKGCIVTTDAMGAQSWIATKIKAQSADYVLALKGNQGKIHKEVIALFETETPAAHAETHDVGHGRIEHRVCDVITNLTTLESPEKWEGLQSLVRITDTRTLKDKTTVSVRYFLSSLPPDAAEILRAVREHWGIENNLHWSLDLSFREDCSRIRIGHAQKNFALLRKFALNFLRKETSVKKGLKLKRFKAGLSNKYLTKVIMGAVR
jgi:predicted transposase YbfD/YdcC